MGWLFNSRFPEPGIGDLTIDLRFSEACFWGAMVFA